MELRLSIFFFLTIFLHEILIGQQETYTITLAPFSSDEYNEFSPVCYKSGIIFCTNRKSSYLFNYSSTNGESPVKINFVDTTGQVTWQKAGLFSRSITTHLNDGPVTFNSNGDTIYFSRNRQVDGNYQELSAARNKLGIFSAVLDGKNWIKIRDMRFNNEWYNVTTPWLSPDGKRLYFASDKPGGYGGSDLYYSIWKNGYWEDPVNMGPVINTSGNESYPFINSLGELFFASDGHPGLGGKDIFFSRCPDSVWISPVGLDPPLNSQYDDFGIITDSLMNKGYFSSNRGKSIDIYQFKTNFPQIFYDDIQRENQHCFRFIDSDSIVIDAMKLEYVWDFGDGEKASGSETNHCFPGSGNYDVKLDIIDKGTGNLFFSKLAYNIDLRDIEQAYINSLDIVFKGDTIDFDGLKSYLPGYKILNFSWDFGDGTRMQGEKVKHCFNDKGEYLVKLGLALKSELNGNIHKSGVSKKIVVLDNIQEKESLLAKKTLSDSIVPDIRKNDNAIVKIKYPEETEFKQEAEFQVELISSETKIGIDSIIFKDIPKKYTVKEIYNQNERIYSYIVDQQMNLMATYITYQEILGLGFKNARIRMKILEDPAAIELSSIKKIFDVSTDNYFDSHGRLTSIAYLLLDQIIKIMNKYPGIKLEVAVHTDNKGLPKNNIILSQNHVQVMTDYIISKGIDKNRLIGKGFGGSRPIAPNSLEKDRALNRRVNFTILTD